MNLPSACAVAQVKVHTDMSHKLNIASNMKQKTQNGFLYKLSDDSELADKLEASLLKVCMIDAPLTKKANTEASATLRAAKHHREQLEQEAFLEKATERQMDILTFHDMYSQPVCWKTEEEVDEAMNNLTTKKAKLEALKDNILIWVIGFGWRQFQHPWSKKGIPFTPEELATHLKLIICSENDIGIYL